MEDKVKVVFEVSKLSKIDLNNIPDWLKFIGSFITNSNKNTNFYFLVNFKEIEIISTFKSDLEQFKNTILLFLKKQNINTEIYFGVFNNPSNIDDDNKIIFYDYVNDKQIDLLNNDSLFFFSCFELSNYLFINGFFSYFLNFNNIDLDEKKLKKISKEVIGEINSENYQEINFSTIKYEFLTFIEKKA